MEDAEDRSKCMTNENTHNNDDRDILKESEISNVVENSQKGDRSFKRL